MNQIENEAAKLAPALPGGKALTLLFERPGAATSVLSAALTTVYGGGLGFRAGSTIANFVSSVDGVAALPVEQESGGIVSAKNPADRFVMGLLRACADTLVVGAGTFRKAARAEFDAAAIYPPGAALFSELRQQLGLAARPQLVVISGSGELEVCGPALGRAWVVTTPEGESVLRSRLPETSRIITPRSGRLMMSEIMALLRADGANLVLTEGGPALFAQLLAEQLIDELFLTVAPALFGRFSGDGRKSVAEGLDLGRARVDLESARLHESYLFLRYGLTGENR